MATPIGNLGDITLRALEILKSADVIACEDTRTSGVLLKHYGITTKTVACHEHNEAEAAAKLVGRMQEGAKVAFISDAGTPLLSDPGARLVEAAIEAGIRVTPIPGASALLAALTIAGLPSAQFFFAGFLPTKAGTQADLLARLTTLPATLVFYEAPHRLTETLEALQAALGDRQAAVARELTKFHEEVQRGPLSQLLQHFTDHKPKGECVILIEGAKETVMDEATIDAALKEALATTSLREAVDRVTALSQQKRSDIYARALTLRGNA